MPVAAVNRRIGKVSSRGILSVSLKILTVALALGAAFSLLMRHRHRTIYSQVPILIFLVSFYTMAIAFLAPPVLALLSCSLRSLTGRTLAGYSTWVLDTPRRMVIACILAAGIITNISLFLQTTPPVFYTQLLDSIQRGGSDNYRQARTHVERIASIEGASDLYLGYTQVLDVLSWGQRVDFEGDMPGWASNIRPLTFSLETASSRRWREHPLRLYALGDAYSLYAQLSKHLASDYGLRNLQIVEDFAAWSEDCFDEVYESKSPLATPGLKQSALAQKGNLFCRMGHYGEALRTWRRANEETHGGAWAGVLMGHVATQNFNEAIATARDALLWTRDRNEDVRNPSGCSRIYANTALAQWGVEDHENALMNCLTATVIQDDEINRLYFAHALIRMGRSEKAMRYLRHFMDPVTPENMEMVASSPSGRRLAPGYILWVLADPNAPLRVQAARLYAALGETREVRELAAMDGPQVAQLLHDVAAHLEENMGICFDFMLVPSTKRQLEDVAMRFQSRD